MAKAAAKAVMTKLGRIVSPKGIAAWAYLTKPAEGIDKDKHKITVFFKKDDPEFKTFFAKLMAAEKEAAAAAKKAPDKVPSCLKLATEKEVSKVQGIAVGDPFIEFSSAPREKNGAIVPIPVVGADAQPTDTDVWGGDIVRVQANMAGWAQTGKRGLKLYLQGVQLLQSNKQGGSGTDMFASDDTFKQDETATAFTPDVADLGENDDLESMFNKE